MFERGGQAIDEAPVGYLYRLTLFGHFSLCTADGTLVPGLSRKAKGLIGYLALNPKVAGRDRLAELLWDGRGVEQARASLRQTCYELRHGLPADLPLILFERDEIRLVRENLTSDIGGLAASSAGLMETLALERGELMRDLNGLSPAFDDWLTGERSRLTDERQGLALDAAHEALTARRWSDAKSIACSLITLDPTDQDAVQIALLALRETGNVKEARALYSRHTDALRRDLDVAPAASTAALFAGLAQTKRSGKTIRVARGRAASAFAEAWTGPAGGRPTSTEAGTRFTPPTRHLGLAAIIGVTAAAALLVAGTRIHRSAAAAQFPLVEVEPLVVPANDQQAEAISAGLRSSLVQKLAGTDTPVQVVDATANSDRPPALIVRGNSLSDHGRLRANVELVAGASGQVLWATTLDRSPDELNQFEEQLSLQLAHELHCAYADGRAPYFERDLELARLTLSHCEAIGRDMEESARFDAEITQRAPQFARGWAEYAMDTSLNTSALPLGLQAANRQRAEAFARRAIGLDPHQGLAYAALAVNLDPATWTDRQLIEIKGLAADPTSPELHFRVADNLASIGRLDDALREAKLAYQYDHLLPGKVFNLGEAEVLVGRLSDASDALAITRKYWPGTPWSDYLTLNLGMAGSNPGDAIRLVDKRDNFLDRPRALFVEAFLRWRVEPNQSTKALAVDAIKSAARRHGSTGEEVQLLAILGEKNFAYQLADRLRLEAAGSSSAWFGPDLADFRSDPRFIQLAVRLGLAQIWWKTGLWPDYCVEGGVSKCRMQVAAILAGSG